MATQKLYPLNTDTFSTDEITVVDNTSATNKNTINYSKANGLYRFETSPINDDSLHNNHLTTRYGAVTITTDATKGEVAVFDNASALVYYDAATFFGGAPVNSMLIDLEFNRDADDDDSEIINIKVNGMSIRFLLSAETFYFQLFYVGSNYAIPYSVTRGDWHRASCLVRNVAGTTYFDVMFDDVLTATVPLAVTPNSTAGYIEIGSSQTGTSFFKGKMNNIYLSSGSFTKEDMYALHASTVNKYPTEAIYTFERDFTDAQMTALLTFAEIKTGEGSLAFLVSKDGGVTDLRYDGLNWVSTGSGYNSAITLNDHLSELDISDTQTLRLKVALISDGWQSVGFEYFQLGYEVNSAPTVLCGASKFGNINEQIYAFNGSTISDVDGNLSQVFYKFDFEASETEILKGAYATFQDVVDNKQIDLTGFPLGEVGYYLRGIDSLGAETICYGTIYVLSDLETKIDAIKAKTDLLTFTGTDVKATLDGELVTTDTASREASKADVSALATQTSVDTIDANVDTIQLRVEDNHDFFFGNFSLGSDGHATWYRKDGITVLLEKLTKSNGVASDTDLTSREEWV